MSPAELARAYPWALRVERFEDDGSYPGEPAPEPPWWPPRSAWGEGPWMAEPDLVEWRAEGIPYPLLILRGDLGALCGYVGVPPTHPCHGQSYRCFNLTWSGPCGGRRVPTGDAPNVWWLGFDCGGTHEKAPKMAAGLGVIAEFLEVMGTPVPMPRERFEPRYIEIGECRERTETLARALLEVSVSEKAAP